MAQESDVDRIIDELVEIGADPWWIWERLTIAYEEREARQKAEGYRERRAALRLVGADAPHG